MTELRYTERGTENEWKQMRMGENVFPPEYLALYHPFCSTKLDQLLPPGLAYIIFGIFSLSLTAEIDPSVCFAIAW